jgi:hypothetical protein
MIEYGKLGLALKTNYGLTIYANDLKGIQEFSSNHKDVVREETLRYIKKKRALIHLRMACRLLYWLRV